MLMKKLNRHKKLLMMYKGAFFSLKSQNKIWSKNINN